MESYSSILVVIFSTKAFSVIAEKLLKEKNYFEEETLYSAFMTVAITIHSYIGFAIIAIAVMVFVGMMTYCKDFFNL